VADFEPILLREIADRSADRTARSEHDPATAQGPRRKTGGRTSHARAEEPPMLRPINARFVRASLQDFDAREGFDEKRGAAQLMPAPKNRRCCAR
jgi:hypothetical protein